MTCSSSVKPHKATERYWRQSRQLIEEGNCATTGAGWLQGLSCREVGVGVRMMWCGHETFWSRWFYVSERKGDIFQVYLIIFFLVIHIIVIIIVFVNTEGGFVIIIIAIIFPYHYPYYYHYPNYHYFHHHSITYSFCEQLSEN